MSDFEYDCLQKKRIASQAKYRKCGSKSKKCSLPSDGMTKKQWKDRCGPVVKFNLNKPLSWDDFKKLPIYAQAEYITHLQQKYGATAVDLGKMFGVQALTVRKHADTNNLKVEFYRGRSMNAIQRAAWDAFLCASEDDEKQIDPADNCTDEYETVGSATPEEFDLDEENTMVMSNFSLRFSGVIDVTMIANSLKRILGDSSKGEIEIICKLG